MRSAVTTPSWVARILTALQSHSMGMQGVQQMSETRTASILQRIPVVLAVTAASYGLALPTAQQQHRASAQHAAPHAVAKAPTR
jgi:hypothetical protein